MNALQITVPFHNNELYVVEFDGQPFTPMKPIVEGMGLDWASQFTKLKQRFGKGIVEITIPSKGGLQSMICLMLRKLPAWLYSIQSGKVKPEIRDTVIMYQNECDDVLWDYWTKGQAVNPRTNKNDRVPLKDAVNMLVAKAKFLNYSDAYSLVHQRFDVDGIDEIPKELLPKAVEYVHHLVGEYVNVEKIDPELRALQLLDADTTNKVQDYLCKLQNSIEKLGGKLPKYPEFDSETIVKAVVTEMVRCSRMMLSFDSRTNQPKVSLIPRRSWMLSDKDFAYVIGDQSGPSKDVLPDIIHAAASRLKK
ncbi:phage antirepressor protein [Acinetobacter baumannii]|uniref:phage antirepressor N-terminal domain-containing protein n=1 Tax=Acinetobacter calcoaceticus/baumannii complex TaxID=909768 RepID=UPI0008396129|nr:MULTISPECIES: phage antirepressor N-terminal domain-containing protein [Acinetobacter calcoaceticus/baumannii complex]EKW2380105.1 phage antirepressor N-terminal domain-containing protein [Acinetobacter baumannii]MCT9452035.1 phage antirepressor N-terminal domain-containing protein [Acinetobacter baumannii]MDV4239011.1 phage antirepressor N-terminal domain-containing protein [Acinetobacter baumannii]OCY90910.1 phage antirepressor protein [Acinetobacter pittii]OTL50458.1 phage antirepressor 